MNLNWLESLIYGLISGLTEFLPVSSQGHQQLMLHLFGAQYRDPVRDLLVHLTMLFALYVSCRGLIDNLQRNRHQRRSRRTYNQVSHSVPDYRFIKNAATPMLAGILIFSYIIKANNSLLLTSFFLLINGLVLFISGRVLQGNKDARAMSVFDSTFVGIASAFSAISGISRVGTVTTVSIVRGADRQHALNWAFLLSIPALILLLGLDVLNIFTVADIPFWKSFFTYILSMLGTYIGSYYSVALMKFLAVRTGYSIFSYYCWGASLFSFLIYLTIA